MKLQKLFEIAGVDPTKGKAAELIQKPNQAPNTRIILGGDVFIIPGSWATFAQRLGSDEIAYIKMMTSDGNAKSLQSPIIQLPQLER